MNVQTPWPTGGKSRSEFKMRTTARASDQTKNREASKADLCSRGRVDIDARVAGRVGAAPVVARPELESATKKL